MFGFCGEAYYFRKIRIFIRKHLLVDILFENCMYVGTSYTKRANAGSSWIILLPVTCLSIDIEGSALQIQYRIEGFKAQRSWDFVMMKCQNSLNKPRHPRRSGQMSYITLD